MTMKVTSWRRRLTGRVSVPLPPEQAFRLFTPLGERDWAPGWEPRFPAATVDDSDPGTAFVTESSGHERTWMVVDRELDRRIRYAAFSPGDRASLITVELTPVATGSEVEVTYDVTALSEAGARGLVDFADGYERYLESWHQQIVAYLRGPESGARA